MKGIFVMFALVMSISFSYGQNVVTKYVTSDTEYRIEERTPCGKLVQTIDCDVHFKIWKSYYDNGKLQAVGYTYKDRKVGKWQFYSAEGLPTMALTYKDNLLIKYEKRLDPNRSMIASN